MHFDVELWWAYMAALGFIVLGRHSLKLYKKDRNPNASIEEKAYGEWFNLTTGVFLILSGIMTIIIITFVKTK